MILKRLAFLSLFFVLCNCSSLLSNLEPDYALETSWAVLPVTQKSVDVFYVYPTIFGGFGLSNMDISDPTLRQKAIQQININTGVFPKNASIYAPYYRQASIDILNVPKNQADQALKIGSDDVLKAFDYYIEHYNQGRPFILAGFSQGSEAILEVMKKRFADRKLQDKLIASYVIGWSVTKQDLRNFPFLKSAQKADDVGVIISYNTQAAKNGYSYVLSPNSVAINPVSWTTKKTKSLLQEHKGAVFFNAQGEKIKEVDRFTSTYLEPKTNALVVDVNLDDYSASQSVFPKGVLHMYDYMFFYNNLKENTLLRIDAYMKSLK